MSSPPVVPSFMPPPNFDGSRAAVAAAARRRVAEDFRLVALRFVAFRLVAPFRAALFRALFLRAAPARVARFALRAAVDFLPRDALLRLPLLFFLPRGGILLLREFSQRAAGEANSLPPRLGRGRLRPPVLMPTGVYTRSSTAR